MIPSTCVHLYQADKDAALDDPEQWHRANPGLACGIKSLSYMEDEARRVVLVPSDQNDFRAQELNLPVDPGKEMICSTLDFNQCLGDAERDGHCVIAWDNGGSNSMTCVAALWPWTGRVEIYGAFAGIPNATGTRASGRRAGRCINGSFEQGELEVYDGHRSTPVSIFLTRCLERLEGQTIIVGRVRTDAGKRTVKRRSRKRGLICRWSGAAKVRMPTRTARMMFARFRSGSCNIACAW